MGDAYWDVFMKLHARLPQQGPGSRSSTLRALAGLGTLVDPPCILDLGCGPGRQTLDLLEATGGHATTIDMLPGFVHELRARVEAAGLADRVTALQGSMLSLGGLPDASFDLIWSEGAIYNVGFERGLAHWRRLVAETGAVAITEVTWLVSDPPERVRHFWDEAYPGMRDVASNSAAAERAGYRVVDTFVLPESDWWDAYYTPISKRIDAWLAEDPEPDVRDALHQVRVEEHLYRDCSDAYGYVFYLLRPA